MRIEHFNLHTASLAAQVAGRAAAEPTSIVGWCENMWRLWLDSAVCVQWQKLANHSLASRELLHRCCLYFTSQLPSYLRVKHWATKHRLLVFLILYFHLPWSYNYRDKNPFSVCFPSSVCSLLSCGALLPQLECEVLTLKCHFKSLLQFHWRWIQQWFIKAAYASKKVKNVKPKVSESSQQGATLLGATED